MPLLISIVLEFDFHWLLSSNHSLFHKIPEHHQKKQIKTRMTVTVFCFGFTIFSSFFASLPSKTKK